ncbi:MAG: SAM-dependent methyltransferase, partial [Tannerella sp.]|nr:SAM-dependent methyltransferase [Tannerella sp.]
MDILQQFISEHLEDDPLVLSLQSSLYPEIDVRWAATLIAARQKLKDKVPAWYADLRLMIPLSTVAEQCSSAFTAAYKQDLVNEADCVCDLTGGLGIDAASFASIARKVIYIDCVADYCEAAKYNFETLGISNIDIIYENAVELVSGDDPRIEEASVFYIDPSRRDRFGRRLYAITDCEPDLTLLWERLRAKAPCVIAKLSPMLDISMVTSQLSAITEIHILAVRNECKE